MAADGGYLTTHVLDTARGRPAADMRIDLFRIAGETREPMGSFSTNEDGRTDQPVLPSDVFATGEYELVFHAGAYLARVNDPRPEGVFLDQVPIRFTISDASAHYHVPLLVSAYGYSTYRGS